MGYYTNDLREARLKKYKQMSAEERAQLEKASPRREVTQTKELYSSYNIPELLEEAEEFAKEWKKTIDDVSIRHSCYMQDYSDSYSSEMHFEVQGLETDEQYHVRLMEAYEYTKAREEHDRKEFERLKAKFKP
jgi:hypothetical protein